MSLQAWNIFMELLRAGLWEQDLRLSAVPDAAGWEQVLQTARAQGVMGLLVRGVAHLEQDQRPPEAVQRMLQAWQTALERASARHDRVQAELLAELHAAGLHPLVQKGSEAARHYDFPQLRQAGDIDLFCQELAQGASGQGASLRALFPQARIASDGAAVFVRDGVTVELHPRYYDVHRAPSELPAPGSPGGEILLLTAHIFKHAVGEGVGCKQLCDLARALAALEGRYDKDGLAAVLRRAGLLRAYRLICALLAADFGLPARYCLPGPRTVDPEPLRRIVRAGGIGHTDAAHGGKLATAGAFLRRLPFALRYGAREAMCMVLELAAGNLRNRK